MGNNLYYGCHETMQYCLNQYKVIYMNLGGLEKATDGTKFTYPSATFSNLYVIKRQGNPYGHGDVFFVLNAIYELIVIEISDMSDKHLRELGENHFFYGIQCDDFTITQYAGKNRVILKFKQSDENTIHKIKMACDCAKDLINRNPSDVQKNIDQSIMTWELLCLHKNIYEICDKISEYVDETVSSNNIKDSKIIAWIIGNHIKIVEAIRPDACFEEMFSILYKKHFNL